MNDFWPKGFDIGDMQSPMEILKVAQGEWWHGGMKLLLQDTTSESGNPMTIVHAKHLASNRTAILFSVTHRSDKPYPVTIRLMDEYHDGFFKSKWVSDTPHEFREKLVKVFNLATIKSKMINLTSDTPDDTKRDVLSQVARDILLEMENLADDTPVEIKDTKNQIFCGGLTSRDLKNILFTYLHEVPALQKELDAAFVENEALKNQGGINLSFEPQRWEYRWVPSDSPGLDEIGADGWEAILINDTQLLFKRPGL